MTATNVAAAGSEELVRKVAAHMTHGEDTAKKYYRHIQGVAESVNKYEVTAGGVGVKRKAPEEEKENYYLPKMKNALNGCQKKKRQSKNISTSRKKRRRWNCVQHSLKRKATQTRTCSREGVRKSCRTSAGLLRKNFEQLISRRGQTFAVYFSLCIL